MAVFDSGTENFLKSSAVMESLDNKEENDIRKKKVGNYLLGKTLGEGSFAKVREGLHIISREKVRSMTFIFHSPQCVSLLHVTFSFVHR